MTIQVTDGNPGVWTIPQNARKIFIRSEAAADIGNCRLFIGGSKSNGTLSAGRFLRSGDVLIEDNANDFTGDLTIYLDAGNTTDHSWNVVYS